MLLLSSRRARKRLQAATDPSVFPGWEQILPEAISKYMKDKKVIWSSQQGFKKGKSFQTNLIAFYKEMISKMDEGRAVDVFYFDFTRAFDTAITSS